MTNLTYTTNPFAQIQTIFNDPFFLGFGDQFVRWETNKKTTSSFPPYNVKKIDEDNFTIELAVAGYDRDELEINVEKDTLTIKSDKENDDKSEFMHRGIAGRNFTQHFTLGEYMNVKSASLENGLLIIKIERELPEEAKPKTIKIK
ncbi:IbpA Molecular chaperone (small heat shock protein) [uncultured Caudovirales phage]|uniref:IbpA Molecular chaperone (Small heat shock protein) n=1 Tax=uncultured Caudovirales phage TaxID=2100421 RepID=A0A6J7WN13_9CAUD|nr:IbpA Molecular chaperone (small heat shock protein) [uncultured Caudovirales phage]